MSTLQLGDLAPDFHAESTLGTIHFHAFIEGRWAILFSHPADFTPVCTTELGAAARLHDAFAQRGVVVIALSVDPVERHHAWLGDIEATQDVRVQYPLLADPERKISTLYGMLHPAASQTSTVRSVFIIGPDKRIKVIISYPASTGRNFDELLRVIDSLQLTEQKGVATPANWRPGGEVVILPSISDDEARLRFPDGFRAERPYLRFVTNPQD